MLDVLKNQEIYNRIQKLIMNKKYAEAKALAKKASQDCEKEMIKFEEYMKKENGYE
jgi:hypothetical protein